MKVLIIEDEVAMAHAMAHLLKKHNYDVEMVHDGDLGLAYALEPQYDIILLDVMLPKLSGIDILKELRHQKIKTPVLMLSAKTEIEDRILGLDSGADDYLPKPFEMDELLARIRAIARRAYNIQADDRIQFNNLSLDKNTLTLISRTSKLKLTHKEYLIIETLIMYPNQTFSKENLIQKVWGFEEDVEDNIIEVYISFLRKKIKALKVDVKIETIRNVGYKLVESEDIHV